MECKTDATRIHACHDRLQKARDVCIAMGSLVDVLNCNGISSQCGTYSMARG